MTYLRLSKVKKIAITIATKIKDHGWLIFNVSILGVFIGWLFLGFLANAPFMFASIYDFAGIQVLRHVWNFRFNINYVDLNAFSYSFTEYMRLYARTSMARPEVSISWFLFSYNFTWSVVLLLALFIKFPSALISGILYIMPNILKYLIGLAAFNSFTFSVVDLISIFSIIKQTLWNIFFNLVIFLKLVLIPSYLYVRDFVTNSLLFNIFLFLVQFATTLLENFMLDWVIPFFKWLGVSFLYFSELALSYLDDTINFFKLCVLHHSGWRPPSTWPIILKYNFYKFLDTHIPMTVARYFLSFVYTPIMATYYFFRFFWIEYFQYAAHFIVMSIFHPIHMFNEVMWYFTADAYVDSWTKKFKIIVSDKETHFSHIQQVPVRRFFRYMWFVYLFLFLYTSINSVAEFIYEYVAELQDHFFDVYEIYLENYGLLYHLFDDYFFTYFLFYFFLLIGFILEAPIYAVDYFFGRPDTNVSGRPFVFFNWLSMHPLIHMRWIHVQNYPFQTYMLIVVSIWTDLIFLIKNIIIHYYNTMTCNEFKAFHTLFFSGDKSYLKVAIILVREILLMPIPYFLTIFNFVLNAFQLNVVFLPLAIINYIFAFITFFTYVTMNFEFVFFTIHLFYDVMLTGLTLFYWLLKILQNYWIECFAVEFISKFPIPLNYIFGFLLFIVDIIKFITFEFPLVAVFEFYFMLHTNLIVNPIVNSLLFFIQLTEMENLEYFPGFDYHFSYLYGNFAMLRFIPLLYVNVYVIILSIFCIYLYTYLFKLFIQMVLYFRLSGILMEIQKLVNFVESPQARRLYYVMHFNVLDIKQTTTALAKERKSSKVVKAFYRKWFGVGHNHFIDYKWRIVTNNLRGLRKLKMQYLIKNKFRRPLIGHNFFYNPLDYVKHIRTLFLRTNYSILRFYGLNRYYFSTQLRHSRSFLDGHTIPGYGLMVFRPTKHVKIIPKYGFPIFSYFQVFSGRDGMHSFSPQNRFLGTKYIFPYGFPSYPFLSNLAWWFYFATILSLQLLIKISLVSILALIRFFFYFFTKK